jgi:PAS domain S-box-containing protein
LSELVEIIDIFIALAHPNGQLLFLNRGGQQLIGVEPGSDVGVYNVLDFVAPAWRPQLALELGERGLERPRHRAFGEFRHLQHGNTFPVEVTLFYLASQGVLAILVADLRERLKMESALQHSERRYRQLVESSPVGLLTVDQCGVVTECNAALTHMLGFGDQVHVSGVPSALADAIRNSPLAEDFRRCLLGGSSLTNEERVLGAQGKQVLLRYHLRPLRGEGGELTGVQAVLEDFSEIRRSEAEAAQLREQLFQAQKLEAIGRLAGGVAHDFNNLLTGIMGYAEILLGSIALEHALRADVEEIRRAAERASLLTTQLLAFSKKQECTPETLELNDFLWQSKRLLERIVGERVSLELRPSGGPLWVRADPSHLDQILVNLCTNARDAMPAGGVIELSLAAHQVLRAQQGLEPGEYAALSIADTGHGMPAELLDLIFEPFFSTKEAGRGIGLGLATVYGVVQQNRGVIHVHSELGRGTRFELLLPLVAQPEPESLVARPEHGELPRGHERILIVEDDNVVRALASRLLSRHGYQVLEASDAKTAQRVFQRSVESVDLLLTDVVMPGANGLELCQALRAMRPALRVVFMSGYDQNVLSGEQCTGVRPSFVKKPFSASSLLSAVRSELDRQSGST